MNIKEFEVQNDSALISLKAMANKYRLGILYLLTERDQSVNDLALTLELPQPVVSQHLKVLKAADMVCFTKDGAQHSYRLDKKQLVMSAMIFKLFNIETVI